MHRRVLVPAALLLLGAVPRAPLAAQAPVITPAGDPSVKSDTIYRLAVRPEDHPDEDYVYLLDDGVVRYDASGRGTQTYRQVVQVLRQDAVGTWAEQQFGYEPGHQRLTVNWIRVVRPDGSVIADKPTQAQDADIPATMGDPVYSDRKVRRFSLSGVAPGTIVDYSYTIEEQKPYLEGDFLESWSITTGHFTRRSRFLVDLPADMTPAIDEHNLPRPRIEHTANGRHTYEWVAQDVARPHPEMFAAADSNPVYAHIAIAAPNSWQRIAAWYAKLSNDRYALTPALETKLHDLVAGAATLDDSLRAVQRWVAQDIRYVSISLGIGGYQPRMPQQVLDTKYGDCKDKATIFVAMARRMGLEAYPVLLNAGGTVTRSVPSMTQFDHAIAAVRRPSGWLYVDLTSELSPLGDLPPADQGEFALVVHPDGHADEVTLPESRPEDNATEVRITGELTPDGLVNARYEQTARGAAQYQLRSMFDSPLDSTRRARFTRALAGNIFTGATGDSLEIFDGRDLRATPRLAVRIHDGQAARVMGSTVILDNPLGSSRKLTGTADELASRGKRLMPIDVEDIFGASTTTSELRLTLPEGWTAQLPKNVSVTSEFGSYSSEYAQEGRVLRITRHITGRRGIEPPTKIGDLIAFLRAVAQDDADYIVVEKGGSTR